MQLVGIPTVLLIKKGLKMSVRDLVLDLILSSVDLAVNKDRMAEIDNSRRDLQKDFEKLKAQSTMAIATLTKEREALETANTALLASSNAMSLQLMNSVSHRRYCYLMGY